MTAIYLVGFLWGFWVLYVFTMAVYRARLSGRLGKINTVLALPFVLLAVVVDFVTNLTIAWVVFWDRPRIDWSNVEPWLFSSTARWITQVIRELFVTTRLKRYMDGPDSWRRKLAVWICDSLLDPFDPTGDHC